MLELDLMLVPFAESALGDADERVVAAYRRLLEREDSELAAWLIAGAPDSGDGDMDELISRIREFHANA